MNLGWKRLVVGAALAGAMSGPAMAYSSWDECLLERMKDQSANMATVVISICQQEFPLERPGQNATRDEIFKWGLEKTSRDIQIKRLLGET